MVIYLGAYIPAKTTQNRTTCRLAEGFSAENLIFKRATKVRQSLTGGHLIILICDRTTIYP
jgi:hypothetical protein